MPVGFPATESGVELRILERLFTPEEAGIALELSAFPEPVGTIHRRFHGRMDAAELERKLEAMEAKGLILSHKADGETRYAKLAYVVGIFERQIKTLTPELIQDTGQYFREGFGKAIFTGKTTQMRVVPINKEIIPERAVATYDSLRDYVASSPGPFAAMPCICRKGKKMMGGSCERSKDRESCLTIGVAATWAVESGNGRAVSREEMLELLAHADRDGLVLQPENTIAPMFVCCCCACCCGLLAAARMMPRPADYLTSNFHSVVDEAACTACGDCLERCPLEAVSLPDGTAVVDLARCIGCGLCASTCPSSAMRLEPNEKAKIPPDDTKALYIRLVRERYGPVALAGMFAKYKMGIKV